MNIYNLLNIDSFKSINDDGNFKYLTTLNSFKLFKILNSLTNDKSELDLTNLTELHKLSAKEILDDIALGETNAAMKVVYCPKVLYILHELCRNDEEMLLETLDDNLSGIVLHSSSLDQRMFLTNENAYNKFLNNNGDIKGYYIVDDKLLEKYNLLSDEQILSLLEDHSRSTIFPSI
jgi:hypothetical protein